KFLDCALLIIFIFIPPIFIPFVAVSCIFMPFIELSFMGIFIFWGDDDLEVSPIFIFFIEPVCPPFICIFMPLPFFAVSFIFIDPCRMSLVDLSIFLSSPAFPILMPAIEDDWLCFTGIFIFFR